MTALQTKYHFNFGNCPVGANGRKIVREIVEPVFPDDVTKKLMHSAPQAGGEKQAKGHVLPPIVIAGHASHINIIATGREAGSILDRYGEEISKLIKKEIGVSSKVTRSVGLMRLEETEEPIKYVMHGFIMRGKTSMFRKRLSQLSYDEQRTALANHIHIDLARTMRAFRITAPAIEDLINSDSVHFDGLQVLDHIAPENRKIRSYPERISTTIFEMRARLEGYWAVGSQLSRGHGAIYAR